MKLAFEALSAIAEKKSRPITGLKRTLGVKSVPKAVPKPVPPVQDAIKEKPAKPISPVKDHEIKEKPSKPKIGKETISVVPEDATAIEEELEKGDAEFHQLTALMKMLTVLVLKTYGQDVDQFPYQKWTKDAAPLLSKTGLLRAVTVASKICEKRGLNVEEVVALGTAVRDKIKTGVFAKILKSPIRIRLLNDIASQLKINSSDPAWNRIHKDISLLGDPKLSALFVDDADAAPTTEVNSAVKKLRTLIKKATGEDKIFISTDEAMKIREQDPDLSAKISAIAKPLREHIKKAIHICVRTSASYEVAESGAHIVPITVVKKYLTAKGLPNNIPDVTGGKIDENGLIYTSTNHMIVGLKEGVIEMNEDFDPETNNTYVCRTVRKPPLRNFEYRTAKMLKSSKDQKFSAVQEFIKHEKEQRAMWLAQLKSKKPLDRAFGAMLEIMYITSARIGTDKNMTKGEKTYGLTTLLVSHIKIGKDKISFDYTGKKGTNQGAHFLVKTPTDRLVQKTLIDLVADKAPTDHVFTYKLKDSQTPKPIKDSYVRMRMKKDGYLIGPHKFRHAAATKMAMEILKRSTFKRGAKQSDVTKWVKDALVEVGIQLHHKNGENETSSTAIKSYIDPGVLTKFFNDLGLELPTVLGGAK